MLVLREADSYKIATRHYVHVLTARLDAADKAVDEEKKNIEAQGISSRDKLDEWYPAKLFANSAPSLERVSEHTDEIIAGAESPRQIALAVQREVSDALINVERDIVPSLGSNKQIDMVIEENLLELFSLSSAAQFVEKSRDARTERVQQLLDPGINFSTFKSMLRLDITLKSMTDMTIGMLSSSGDLEKYIDELCDEIDEIATYEPEALTRPDELVEDLKASHQQDTIDGVVEPAASGVTYEHFVEASRAAIDRMFVSNESTKIVENRVNELHSKTVAPQVLKKAVSVVNEGDLTNELRDYIDKEYSHLARA